MKKLSKKSLDGFINYGIVVAFFIVCQILSIAGVMTNSLAGQLVPICSYVIMALSLNLVVGISGELSLGHAGFMSVGAFSAVLVAALIGKDMPGLLTFIVAVIVAVILAAIAGALIGIPVLRLKGDYLAIVTLAFGEIIKSIVNNLFAGVSAKGLHFSMFDDKAIKKIEGIKMVLKGPQGASGVTKLSSFLAGIVLVLITLFIIQNLVNSRTGRAIEAIRDSKIAASASGISAMKYKLIAFVMSAALAGGAGALYALNFSTVAAKKFDFNTSILILVFVVLGGIGNMRGSIIAATLLTILPELLRQFQDYRMLVYAIVLILVMIISNNNEIKNKLFGVFKKNKKEGADNE